MPHTPLHALLSLALLALGPRPAGPALGESSERGESVAIELVRTGEIRFELELAGEAIEGFELATESRRTKRVRRTLEDDEPVLLVTYDEAQDLFRGPDGEREEVLDIEGLSARVGRSGSGFSASSEAGGGLGRDLEELVLREELAPDGEALALEWLLATLAALEVEEGASTELEPQLVLWLVGDDKGMYAEVEGALEARGVLEREDEDVLVLALSAAVEGESEDEVEFALDLEGEIWLEPRTRRPLRIAIEGPLTARGESDSSGGVSVDGEGRFALRVAFDWER